jgi:CRP-like cAMP-binding protein
MKDQVANKYLRLFLDRHTSVSYKKGDIVIFQGEAPKHAYVVKDGIIKAYNLSINGDEKPVAFYKEDSIFPGSWVYGATPTSLYYYEVLSPTATVYSVKKEELAEFIKKDPNFYIMSFRNIFQNNSVCLLGSMLSSTLELVIN